MCPCKQSCPASVETASMRPAGAGMGGDHAGGGPGLDLPACGLANSPAPHLVKQPACARQALAGDEITQEVALDWICLQCRQSIFLHWELDWPCKQSYPASGETSQHAPGRRWQGTRSRRRRPWTGSACMWTRRTCRGALRAARARMRQLQACVCWRRLRSERMPGKLLYHCLRVDDRACFRML